MIPQWLQVLRDFRALHPDGIVAEAITDMELETTVSGPPVLPDETVVWLKDYKADDNRYWSTDSGTIQCVLDELIDYVESVEAKRA
jgi:hypothetical protein